MWKVIGHSKLPALSSPKHCRTVSKISVPVISFNFLSIDKEERLSRISGLRLPNRNLYQGQNGVVHRRRR